MIKDGWQGPTTGNCARTYGDLFMIVTHPAFRIGFLDVLNQRSLDHDRIAQRIAKETPSSYFKRKSIETDYYEKSARVELAQYRYEEGRLAVIVLGLRCKGWGHPDFLPKKVRQYIWEQADKTPAVISEGSIVVQAMRGASGPLFEARK